MKVSHRRPHNLRKDAMKRDLAISVYCIGRVMLFLLCLSSLGFATAEESTTRMGQEVKSKTYKEWINYYFPYFKPTSAELHEQLKKDPDWAPFINGQASSFTGGQQTIKVPKIPKSSMDPSRMPKKASLPEGSHMAVIIPKGASLPSKPASVDQTQNVKLPETSPAKIQSEVLTTSSLPAPPMPLTSASRMPGEPGSLSPGSLSPYVGLWSGQYSKLIEYYDPNTKSWNASENSLRNIPVELRLQDNGILNYKMPERQGSATYVFKGPMISIVCEDVRIRGDYFIQQKDPQNLNLKTSRELVKDKMRVSLEFELLLKQ